MHNFKFEMLNYGYAVNMSFNPTPEEIQEEEKRKENDRAYRLRIRENIDRVNKLKEDLEQRQTTVEKIKFLKRTELWFEPIEEEFKHWARDSGWNSPNKIDVKQLINKWIQYYEKVAAQEREDSEPIEQPKEKAATPKIKFLGNQKQLAELFSVLIENGWVEKGKEVSDINAFYKAIQNTFLYANKRSFEEPSSINQYLEPSQDQRDYSNNYEKIHTTDYKAMFHAIKKRT